MYVCICNAVTDKEIRECMDAGACSLRELRDQLGVASKCGRCAHHAQQLMSESESIHRPDPVAA